MRERWSRDTRAIHPPRGLPRRSHAPVSAPIYQTVAYETGSAADAYALLSGTKPGFVYSRIGNPTSAAFAAAVADLEGASPDDAASFSSGMAAILGTLTALGVRAGDRIVAARDLYGNTLAVLSGELRSWGVAGETVDASDPAAVQRALGRGARILFVEAMSNPLLRVPDLPTLARAAHRNRALLVVDATFATPLLVRPLEHHADAVLHSATKSLSGHGDVTAGVAVAPGRGAALRRAMANLGAALSPHDAWLALRGMKTLSVRLERACRNAARLAAFLSAHPAVGRVWYPGDRAHPDHAVATRLFGRAFGEVDGRLACSSLVSFELRRGGRRGAWRFVDRVRLILRATTLGEVETLVLHPATTSHRKLSAAARRAAGIRAGLVRLAVGIEGFEDLRLDVERALRGL